MLGHELSAAGLGGKGSVSTVLELKGFFIHYVLRKEDASGFLTTDKLQTRGVGKR